MPAPTGSQYATDANLAARQRLWRESPRDRDFDFHGWVIGLAGIGSDDRVVEVGCGNGLYLERLPGAVGVDLSPGMLDAARRRSPRSSLVAGDAQALPLRDARFDVVLAPHMLYHVPDRTQAAREMRRVLRPGGVCVAATNGEANHAEMVGLVEDVVGGGWRWERSAMTTFSVENGARQLAVAFDEVESHVADSSTFHVVDADALGDYLASVGDLYQPQLDVPWPDVVAECRRRAAEIIERDGAFRISTVTGAFVCR